MIRLLDAIRRVARSDRGEVVVTTGVILAGTAVIVILGVLTGWYGRSQGQKTQDARQGITIDDNGDPVMGGVGVIPVPTPEPKKSCPRPQSMAPVGEPRLRMNYVATAYTSAADDCPTPAPAKPRVVIQDRVVDRPARTHAPAPQPQEPQVIVVDPGDGYVEPGTTHSGGTTTTDSDDDDGGGTHDTGGGGTGGGTGGGDTGGGGHGS